MEAQKQLTEESGAHSFLLTNERLRFTEMRGRQLKNADGTTLLTALTIQARNQVFEQT